MKSSRAEIPWFPQHISEIDECSNLLTKYEPHLFAQHPAYGDEAYIARRKFLNDQALSYRHGDELPIVEYTKEENEAWRTIYQKLMTLRDSHACAPYRKFMKVLEEERVLSPKAIPQLRDVNEYLSERTGFTLRPCGGYLTSRDFLASLAFRVFQTTIFIRTSKSLHHSPDPDLIHDLLGHVPMLADPILAQMSQDIGLMSLGATDEQIERLANVYWHIIEFGLCRENGQIKAIGAGLLSAYGELVHACSDKPAHLEFDPAVAAIKPYEDDHYQSEYFVAKSLENALEKVRQYANYLDRTFSVVYNAANQSIEVVNRPSKAVRSHL